MLKFVVKRVLLLIPIMLAASFIVFGILYLTPVDPARILLGASATPESLEALREELGVDQPFFVQYANYLMGAFTGDFGVSYRTGQLVFNEIFVRFPVTLKLAGLSILVVALLGIPLGVIAAVKEHSPVDYAVTSLSLFLSSIPSFWLALILILVFALTLGVLPSYGVDDWRGYVLPVVALSLPSVAELTRMTRASMLETIHQDYIRTDRAKGVRERVVIWVHAFKNALMPVITVIGSNFGSLLGGAVVIETVFALPGLGSLIVTSIRTKDVPQVMAGTLFIVLMFCIVLLIVDVAYAYIDPRVRTRYESSGGQRRRHAPLPSVDLAETTDAGEKVAAGEKDDLVEQAAPDDRTAPARAATAGVACVAPSTPEADIAADDGFVERERFAFIKRFCENKVAVVAFFVLVAIILSAILANFIADPALITYQDMGARSLAPCAEHIFGTDGFGRDIFARVLYGARTSLLIAFITVAISCFAGMVLGVTCGYFGGVLDMVLMRVVDVFMCLPPLLFSLSIMAALGNGMQNLIMAVCIAMIPYFTRVIRSTALSVSNMGYVEAAKASGTSDFKIIFRHIVPNCVGPIVVEATVSLSFMIMLAASLSFIGLGVQPPTPEWGYMISDARQYMRDAPWMILAPGLAIAITSLAFNLTGDGIRDALDPRRRK